MDSRKSVVAVAGCKKYEYEEVEHALSRCLGQVEENDAVIKKGNRVLLKINLLSVDATPDNAVTTHPILVKAVINWVRARGGIPTVGDGTNSKSKLDDPFEASGLRKICNELEVPLVDFRKNSFNVRKIHDFHTESQIPISEFLTDSDLWINLPKLKTHELTILTGALKNCYGNIPFGLKGDFHAKYRTNEKLADVIVDIYRACPPSLTIMDAIVGMEGDGPFHGNPINIGLILASRDAVALDRVAAEILKIDHTKVFYISKASDSGFGNGKIEDIELRGSSIEKIALDKFALPKSVFQHGLWFKINTLIYPTICLRPSINQEKCVQCNICAKRCPVNVIKYNHDKKLEINSEKCILCYCCHEMCPENAINMRRKFTGEIIVKAFLLTKKIMKPFRPLIKKLIHA